MTAQPASTTPTSPAYRPGGITLIMVLAIIGGIFEILGGIWIIIDRADHRLLNQSNLTENGLLGAGIVAILFGTVWILVALALGRGSRVARLVFGILAVLNLAAGLYALVALHGEQQWSGAFQTAIAIIVLYLLYGSERDREFFLDT
jgi:hypothetical protein